MRHLYVRSKQFITYLLLLMDDILRVAFFICNKLSWMIHKTVKRSAQDFLIYGSRSIKNRKLQYLYCVCVCVCVWERERERETERERLLYKHSFKLAHRKKSRTVRSGEHTGNGIPDTWKCFSSLVKTPHTPPIHCHRTGFETPWYHFLLGLQTLSSTPLVRRKCVVKRVNQLRITLYKAIASIWSIFWRVVAWSALQRYCLPAVNVY
jgi:hypothetical protein